MTAANPAPAARLGSPDEVLLAFARLGIGSFGGPIAHLGYFRAEFVTRRRWLDEAAYADLVALCQFLPGPASSQVGFSLGLIRAGWLGGLAAWTGFTLPSAAALVLLAYGAAALHGRWAEGVLHGLKLVAVAVVAQAVWGMAHSLCPDRPRAAIAVLAALLSLLATAAAGQIAAILLGGIAGLVLCRGAAAPAAAHLPAPVGRTAGAAALALFALLLAALPVAHRLVPSQALALIDAFYRAGALVFGGGHVVLPLLRAAIVTPGWIGDGAFLAGYGAAQAVPGPLFTIAAYLGTAMRPEPHGIAGAALALLAIFLPGLLLVTGALPFWAALRRGRGAQAAMRGVNAAVVGILVAALYDPLWTGSVATRGDFALALLGFVLLAVWRAPPLLVVLLGTIGGAGLAAIGG